MPWLPFDKTGFALFYNKDLLDEAKVDIPETWEDLQDACEKLKAAGYDVHISAGPESFRLCSMIADAYYRGNTSDILVQPGDALWDESTMSANEDFEFDESNPLCDQFTVFSVERQMKYASENGIATEANKKIYDAFYTVEKYFPDNWVAADSTQAIADFEGQISPLLYQASFNAGTIVRESGCGTTKDYKKVLESVAGRKRNQLPAPPTYTSTPSSYTHPARSLHIS